MYVFGAFTDVAGMLYRLSGDWSIVTSHAHTLVIKAGKANLYYVLPDPMALRLF